MLKDIIKDELASIEKVVADAFKNWRTNYAKLSQQNIHDFCRAKNIPVYNSQIAYLEKANLDAKRTMYFGLEHMNKELADKKNKFLYVQNKNLREKLIAAEPFLTHDNRVADKFDFAAIMLGEKINKKYISSELSADIAAAYYKVVTEVFNEIARQEMISPREAWQQFVKTKAMKNVPESDYQAFQDILRGARVPTVQEVLDSKNAYGYLPCYDAFKEWTKNNVPKKLTDAYQLMGI